MDITPYKLLYNICVCICALLVYQFLWFIIYYQTKNDDMPFAWPPYSYIVSCGTHFDNSAILYEGRAGCTFDGAGIAQQKTHDQATDLSDPHHLNPPQPPQNLVEVKCQLSCRSCSRKHQHLPDG